MAGMPPRQRRQRPRAAEVRERARALGEGRLGDGRRVGAAPAFVKFEGPMFLNGPPWRIELTGPRWER